MATPDIELIISAQNEELLKELADTKKRVTALGKEFKKSDVGNYSKTRKGLQSISKQLDRTKKQVVGFFLSWQALRGVFSGARGIANDLLTTSRSFETLRIQLKQLQGSAKGGAEAFKFIKDFAKNTPLQLEGVTKSFVKLKALGLDPMDGTMQSLVDINAKMGGSQESLEGIILGVGQAWTKGKLQAEEANQLIERGIPVWEILSKVTGKAGGELQSMASKGLLGRDAIRALIDEMGRSAQGAAIEQIATLNGQISNLQDNWSQFLDLVGESGAKDYFLEQITAINNAITELSESGDLERYAQEISDNLISIAESLKTGAVFIYDNAEALKTLARIAAGLGALKVGSTILGWAIASGKATAALNAQGAATVSATTKIKGLAKSFFSLNTAMAAFIGYEIGTYLRKEFDIVKKAGIALASGVHEIVLTVISKFKELAAAAEFVLSEPVDAAKTALLEYVKVLSSIIKYFGPVGSAASLAFKKLANDIKPGTKAANDYKNKLIEIRAELKKNQETVRDGYAEQFSNAGTKSGSAISGSSGGPASTPAQKSAPISVDLDVGISDTSKAKVIADAKNLEKDIQARLLQARIDTLNNEGNIVEARSLELHRQYDDLISKLQSKGDVAGIELINNLINTELAQAKLQQLKEQFDATLSELRAKEQSITNQNATGALTDTQATEQMILLRQSQSLIMDELIAKTQALYAETSDPKVLEALNGMKSKIKENVVELDKFGQSAQRVAEGHLSGFFEDIFSGTKSAKVAFADMARSFSRVIAKMLAEALAAKLIKSLFNDSGDSGDSGGAGGFLNTIMGFFKHTGGMVGAASISRKMSPLVFAGAPRLHDGGMLKNDEVPTILQKGEEVLAKNDPRNAANGGDSGGSTRIINVIDPNMVSDYMSSANGEKVVLNILQRNPGAVKQVLT